MYSSFLPANLFLLAVFRFSIGFTDCQRRAASYSRNLGEKPSLDSFAIAHSSSLALHPPRPAGSLLHCVPLNRRRHARASPRLAERSLSKIFDFREHARAQLSLPSRDSVPLSHERASLSDDEARLVGACLRRGCSRRRRSRADTHGVSRLTHEGFAASVRAKRVQTRKARFVFRRVPWSVKMPKSDGMAGYETRISTPSRSRPSGVRSRPR
jgi:hypothetical protein